MNLQAQQYPAHSLHIRRKLHSAWTRLSDASRADNANYWRGRALRPDGSPVLWGNEAYNECVRGEEKRVLLGWLRALPEGARVLDMGCGIGVISAWMADVRPDLNVEGVDFPEMIQVARERNARKSLAYTASPAEEFLVPDASYDLILSCGCFAAINDDAKRTRAISNAGAMAARGTGIVVMIDPFHKWPFLARAICSPQDVTRLMNGLGFECIQRSGILFWPFRELVANSGMSKPRVRALFRLGELLLRLAGRLSWSDYKVLVFRRVR